MNILLQSINDIIDDDLQITGSKSEANRLLILQALYPEIEIENLSNSDDSKVMQQALADDKEIVDVHHAGTAMRFLTAYFACQNNRTTVMTGSQRMQERPIAILVNALRDLGAVIKYQKQDGCPPIEIQGKNFTKDKVTLKANVSSQYISALMLIAPSLPNGLEISLEGKVTSVPYIKMTLNLLKDVGVKGDFENNIIKIYPTKVVSPKTIVVESDWSSASYFYSIVALSKNATITLGSYKRNSYQGDAVLAGIYKGLGVETTYEKNTVTLRKLSNPNYEISDGLDLSNSPDIAQTIAVTCFGLGIGCHLTGLHTLKIKETDRLEALKAEINKLGGKVEITDKTLTLQPSGIIKDSVEIETYKDHRMAMAFAPLALRTSLKIMEANVVTKSYPDFWTDLKKIGFKFSQF